MTATTTRTWETVIGLEVHCELATASKLFCGCPNEFGDEPNTNVCPVCLGLPGSLPVLNAKAGEYALRVAEALNLRVPERSVFARKNYFYPDMPKNYPTSQYDEPITIDGWLEIDGVRVGVTRAHLEEDTGKSPVPQEPCTRPKLSRTRLAKACYVGVDPDAASFRIAKVAGVTQLAECGLSKPDVEGSTPFTRYFLPVAFLRSI